jgi:probable O-glycosylation ligase (exosortase A-associated)
MGVLAFGTYLLFDRRSPPPIGIETILQVTIAVYMTASMFWAVRPDAAWEKWDWAFKTMVFAAFVPFVIRSRVQIEAMATTYVFSLAANFVPFGLKTIISGGGYGTNLGLQGGNAGLAEGGQLSTVCLMAVPLAVFLSRHGQLIPRMKVMPLAYWAVAALALITAIGTYERSALIGLLAILAFMVARSKHKIGYTMLATFVLAGLFYFTSAQWVERISTIKSFDQESSAYTRILVWKWTLGFVGEHPFGGGLMAFLVNHIELPAMDGGPAQIQFGRAFHSIYFEMLGELGYPGLFMFLTVALVSFIRLFRTARRARKYPELEWVWALSNALQAGMAAYLTAGAFVSIAFVPMFWYFIAMSISLNAYMYRVEHGMAKDLQGWRATAAAPRPGGWRDRPAALARSGPISRIR